MLSNVHPLVSRGCFGLCPVFYRDMHISVIPSPFDPTMYLDLASSVLILKCGVAGSPLKPRAIAMGPLPDADMLLPQGTKGPALSGPPSAYHTPDRHSAELEASSEAQEAAENLELQRTIGSTIGSTVPLVSNVCPSLCCSNCCWRTVAQSSLNPRSSLSLPQWSIRLGLLLSQMYQHCIPFPAGLKILQPLWRPDLGSLILNPRSSLLLPQWSIRLGLLLSQMYQHCIPFPAGLKLLQPLWRPDLGSLFHSKTCKLCHQSPQP